MPGPWEGVNVLVTGAAGFIGSHLTERLLALGARVTGFIRYTSRSDAGLLAGVTHPGLRLVAGDLKDADAVRRAMEGAEVILHLGALIGIPYSYAHPNDVVQVNTLGTLNVLAAARDLRPRKLVITSTSEVYGSALRVPIDEGHPRQPQSPYAASKIAADAVALSFHRAFEFPVAIVRPFNTFGPRQSDRAIIPTIISQALAKGRITIGDTRPTRDFTYVTDTVEGMLRVAESERSNGEDFNLGSGQEISIGDLARRIAGLIGITLPVQQAAERLRPAKSEVTRLLAATAKAREVLGWTPAVSLDDGLRNTIQWIREHPGQYQPDVYRI